MEYNKKWNEWRLKTNPKNMSYTICYQEVDFLLRKTHPGWLIDVDYPVRFHFVVDEPGPFFFNDDGDLYYKKELFAYVMSEVREKTQIPENTVGNILIDARWVDSRSLRQLRKI
jgi:hypothetical protein